MPSFSSALPRKKTRVKIIDEKKMTYIHLPLDFFTGLRAAPAYSSSLAALLASLCAPHGTPCLPSYI
jgi:hypothetical protein